MINLWVLENGFMISQTTRPFMSDKLSSFAYMLVTNSFVKCQCKTIGKDKVDKQDINLFFLSIDKKYRDIQETNFKVLKHYKKEIQWCIENNITVVIEKLWELDEFTEHDYQFCIDNDIPINSPKIVFLYPGCVSLRKFKKLCSKNVNHKLFNYYYLIYYFRKIYDNYFNEDYFNFNVSKQKVVYDYSFVLGRIKNSTRKLLLKKYNEGNDSNSIIYYYHDNYFNHVKEQDQRFTNIPKIYSKSLVYDKAIPFGFYQSKFNIHCETHIAAAKRFVTEKSMKVVLPLRPAAIIGAREHNKLLKDKLGFELYEEIFDYSLLDEKDNMVNAFIHFNELSKLPNSFFDEPLIKEKCLHNKQQFLNISSDEHFYKTSTELINQWIK